MNARIGVWSYEVTTTSHHWCDSMYAIHGLTAGTALPSEEERLGLVHPDDRDRVLQAAVHASQRGSTMFRYRILQPGGETRLVEASITAVRDDTGRTVRLCGAVLDVTDQLRMHEMLTHAQRQGTIGSIAGGIAHDFGNLLVSVSLSATRLRRELTAATDRASHCLEDIDLALRRARELIRHLHGYANRRSVESEAVHLAEVIHSVEPLLRRLTGEVANLTLRLDDDLPPARIDRVELEQVLVNLVVNARDALPGGGRISVFAHEDAGFVVLEVADDGIGMDEATRERIFEPFFTTKGPDQGTGLGLPTSRAIVERVGGSLTCDSRPGAGSVFRVRLPADELSGLDSAR
jgi:two-component system, cell cycle sensor histidine kinase and response regulator CckA